METKEAIDNIKEVYTQFIDYFEGALEGLDELEKEKNDMIELLKCGEKYKQILETIEVLYGNFFIPVEGNRTRISKLIKYLKSYEKLKELIK